VTAKDVFILGASADIGKGLMEFFRHDGFRVAGTFRSQSFLNSETKTASDLFLNCDFSDRASVIAMAESFKSSGRSWDVLLSAVGTMEPVGRFVDVDFDEWQKSVETNFLSQLRAFHLLYPFRRKDQVNSVVLFAGGGTNNPFRNYSAYCVSKIALIKMCELLDDECPDLNVFIVGPGWVRTKIHEQTLKLGDRAGVNYAKTREFMESNHVGTDLKDIYRCIVWGIEQGRPVAGGRNFSVVHDKWGEESLRRNLVQDQNLFKLRRYSQLKEE